MKSTINKVRYRFEIVVCDISYSKQGSCGDWEKSKQVPIDIYWSEGFIRNKK